MGMKKRFILSLFYNKVKHTERKAFPCSLAVVFHTCQGYRP